MKTAFPSFLSHNHVTASNAFQHSLLNLMLHILVRALCFSITEHVTETVCDKLVGYRLQLYQYFTRNYLDPYFMYLVVTKAYSSPKTLC